jgi:hypothetical protein
MIKQTQGRARMVAKPRVMRDPDWIAYCLLGVDALPTIDDELPFLTEEVIIRIPDNLDQVYALVRRSRISFGSAALSD